MEGLDLLTTESWQPLATFGLTGRFFSFNYETVMPTWILLGMLVALIIPLRWFLHKKTSIIRFLTISFLQSFVDLCQQTLGHFSFKHFSFITSLFIFILFANFMMIIPFLAEPTQDINTTLALGIIAFVYIQWNAILEHGIIAYLKEYLTPFFIMFPLHVVGKLATIVSMSFRLFGNIFGGATIAHIYFGAIKSFWFVELLFIPVSLVITIFFGIFEGFLQAFVFTMLTLTYLSIALQNEEPEHTKVAS